MRADDHSLTDGQYRTVYEAATTLLERGNAKGRFPTPVGDLMEAANLQMAPLDAFEESSITKYLKSLGAAAAESASKFIRRAMEKVRGVLDSHARTVHVDSTVDPNKQRFLKLHEAGHAEIPHQSGLYRFVQDCFKTLSPDVADLFEREANTFATIVLFQDKAFTQMVADESFGIKVPLRYGKKFGASTYAAMREYVRHHHRACVVLVFDPTVFTDDGHVAEVRRVEMSVSFARQFPAPHCGTIRQADPLMKFIPLVRRMSSPQMIRLQDLHGAWHDFVGEGFKTTYNSFVLLHSRASLDHSGFLVPAPRLFPVA